ncbi:MAG: alcohol dehydrogenase family protein [Rhizobiaceae bacterium]
MSDIPRTMRAMVLTGHGGLDKLVFQEDWPVPAVGPDDVLIRVEACGLNNTDVNTRSGWYSKAVSEATTGDAYESVDTEDPSWGGAPITFPRIQGADAVGIVVAVGANADDALIGERVMADCWLRDWSDPLNRDRTGYFGSERDGGFAEYTTADHRNVGVVDSDLPSAELATFSCSYTTAEGMLSRAGVTNKDTVLITGASGGVGSALIQLAKRRGAKVVALASEAKHGDLAPLGADVLLPRSPENLKQALADTTGSETVSVVADIVGGPYFTTLIDALERGGRYTCSGAIAGPIVELDLRTFYLRDLTFTGSTVLPPHIFTDLVGYIECGEIRPMLAATWPLEQLRDAQQAFIDKKHTGNIAVTVG